MIETNQNWTCPHCGRPQVLTDANHDALAHQLRLTELDIGDVAVEVVAQSCLNKECKKLTLVVNLWEWLDRDQAINTDYGKLLVHWHLMPESSALPQPEFIPAPLRDDYFEACRIRDLSPKASATLARRCLQGMIRDFCGISGSTLHVEVNELRSLVVDGIGPQGVTRESVDAVDQVRKVGNVGVHMEQDINLITEVDPGEAQALIELIEMLFSEWYMARRIRQQRLEKIGAIVARLTSAN
jgi:hypothetical protein